MNLADMLLNQNQGAIVQQLAGQLGIGEDQARSAAAAVLPTLARGMQRNAQSQGGLDALLGALQKGNHEQYYDQPETLGRPDTIADGNAILGHLLGSKDVSRNVAGHASQQTGVDSSLIKQMLPMLAAAVMGAMGKQTQGGGGLLGQLAQGLGGATGGSSGGGLGDVLGAALGGGGSRGGSSGSPGLDMLSSFLDADKDGSMADDLLGMAQKFF